MAHHLLVLRAAGCHLIVVILHARFLEHAGAADFLWRVRTIRVVPRELFLRLVDRVGSLLNAVLNRHELGRLYR